MSFEDAACFGVVDGERVAVEIGGERGGFLTNTLVRVKKDYRLEFHLDTDEANGVGLKNGDTVMLKRIGGEAGLI